ncbi:MAG: hypothetical protein WCK89_16355 [bacterium]
MGEECQSGAGVSSAAGRLFSGFRDVGGPSSMTVVLLSARQKLFLRLAQEGQRGFPGSAVFIQTDKQIANYRNRLYAVALLE